jgi:hypothetical protein
MKEMSSTGRSELMRSSCDSLQTACLNMVNIGIFANRTAARCDNEKL